MSTLAVIGTFYNRLDAIPEIASRVRAQTRRPDYLYLLAESPREMEVLVRQDWGCWFYAAVVGTPRDAEGRYLTVPYSHKINLALDLTRADYIAYLTDDSYPEPDKYEAFVRSLDAHPEQGVVFVNQRRNGGEWRRDDGVGDAYCVIDHTQVCHRRSPDRWTTDLDKMTLGDAHFWRALHERFGAFYPTDDRSILDIIEQTPDGITGRA